MRALYWTILVKRELSHRQSFLFTIYIPALTCAHELWVMAERMRSRIQGAKMSFLRRVAGLSLRDTVRSLDIRREHEVEPLLLHIKGNQLRWFEHLIRMPPRCFPLEVFPDTGHIQRWGDPRVDPGFTGGITCFICHGNTFLGGSGKPCWGEVWNSLLSLPPSWPNPGYAEDNGWMDG